jgi:hypothetical protein
MVSLHSLARRAVFGSRWQFIPFDEKHEIAWSAIAEELYSSTEQPRAHDLIRLGERAIDRHVGDLGHMYGFDYHRSGHPPMPRYLKFWWTQPTLSPEDRIIDVLAFRQVVGELAAGPSPELIQRDDPVDDFVGRNPQQRWC